MPPRVDTPAHQSLLEPLSKPPEYYLARSVRQRFSLNKCEKDLDRWMTLNYYTNEDRNYIINAFRFAALHHAGQERLSGMPYLSHPYWMAVRALRLGSNPHVVAGCLLHDVVEENRGKKGKVKRGLQRDLEGYFGRKMAKTVKLLTRPHSTAVSDEAKLAEYDAYADGIIDSGNIDAFVIKALDVTHNAKTLQFMSDGAKRERQVQKFLKFRNVAELVAPQIVSEIDRHIRKAGVALPGPKPSQRVVIAPSRLKKGYYRALPPALNMSAVVYEPTIRPHFVDFALPLDDKRGYDSEYWSLMLQQMVKSHHRELGASPIVEYFALHKTLPTGVGMRLHVRAKLRGRDYLWLAGELEKLHKLSYSAREWPVRKTK